MFPDATTRSALHLAAIVRHIVEMHGGTIEATSAGPGKGSTFRVELPIAATASQAAPAGGT